MEATHGIVPEILDEIPPNKFTIVYQSSKQVNFGNELTLSETKNAPRVEFPSRPGKYYTLLMLDPDAPSRNYSFLGQINHWFVGNMTGSDLESGQLFASYGGPGAPRFTGLHRYMFVVFEHDAKIDFASDITSSSFRARIRWNLREFMKKYGLKCWGWNYFQAQWESKGNGCNLL